MLCPSCNAPNRDDAKFCKKCGQPLRVEATKIPEAAVVSQVSAPVQEQTDAEDISSEPTQIISPQQMVEYHNRRWQQELEREQTAQAQPSTSASVAPPAANESAQNITDMPTVIINPPADAEPVLAPVPVEAAASTQPPAQVDEPAPIPPQPPAPDTASPDVFAQETAAQAHEDTASDAQAVQAPAGEVPPENTSQTREEKEDDGVTQTPPGQLDEA
jgi:hypothetical protein